MPSLEKIKFVYFGTPYVAGDTLAVLIAAGYVPEVVITNPDAPRGRKHVMTPSETKVLAEENGLQVLTPEKFDDETIAEILKYECDLGIAVAYGKILPEKLINAFPKGILNIHYSLLPKYRGATPVEAALLNGDEATGVTIQKMVRQLDAGDIVTQTEVAITPTETTKELRPRLVQIGAKLLVEILPHYLADKIEPLPQNHEASTHVGKLEKADGEISLSDPDKLNWRKYRAYAEWPGTFFMHEGKRIKITEAECTDGTFRPVRVIPEGKKEVEFSQYFESV